MTSIGPMLEKYQHICANPKGQERESVDALHKWIQPLRWSD
ncbi:MAG: hypothetical protein NTW86_25700 [Candidatus Sumerlaeota bacterium]|nr:hypothetical protein [Candidatus Sumerlaeota bacterium]